jgi:hypothetical protein
MSNMDFNDPKDPNFRTRTANYGSSWAWIAGAAAIVVVLFLIFGLAGTNTNTASNPPATTTGQASRPMTPPATTGQASPSALPANPAGTAAQPDPATPAGSQPR